MTQMIRDETELAVVPLRETNSSPVDLKTRAPTSKPSLFLMVSATSPKKLVIIMFF